MSEAGESGFRASTLKALCQRAFASQRRQAREALTQLLQVRGLMPLLMKPRNGNAWTAEEKAQLLCQLRILSRLSPYLLLLALPGSALFLPLYAWWLDRRRGVRTSTPADEAKPLSALPPT